MKNEESESVVEFIDIILNNTEKIISLSSSYKQKKFCVDTMKAVLPVKVTLGTTLSAALGDDEVVLNENNSDGYFIPMLPSLNNLVGTINLSKDDLINDLDFLKKDIFDGEFVQEQMNNFNSDDVLAFALYCDDIETVNPIGNSRKIHKLSKQLYLSFILK